MTVAVTPKRYAGDTTAWIDRSKVLSTAIMERPLVDAEAVGRGAGQRRVTLTHADPTIYLSAGVSCSKRVCARIAEAAASDDSRQRR